MASKTAIRFKVELKHKSEQSTFHRFTGTYNFSELSSVVSHLWGERPKHSVLNYIDDEGDAIRIATEAEWEECVRLFLRTTSPVLRLSGERAKGRDKRRAEAALTATTNSASSSSDSESDEDMPLADVYVVDEPHVTTTGANRVSPPPAAAACHGIAVPQLHIPAPEVPAPPVTQKDEEEKEMRNDVSKAELPPLEADPKATAVDLMSLVYNCDAGEELFSGDITKFADIVKRVVDPANPDEVHLDIDRSKLFRNTTFKISELISNSELRDAELLVKTSMVVFEDNVQLQYKLACIFSLSGSLEDSLDMLLVAQANGFEDVNKLKSDTDLAKVRKHPRFVEVVPAEDAAQIDYFSEVDKSAPSAPTQAQATKKLTAPVTSQDPNVLSLIAMFPDMSIDEAVCVLVLAEGDLTRAINARLSGDYQRPNYVKGSNVAPSAAARQGGCWAPPQGNTGNTYLSKAERNKLKRQAKKNPV